MKARLLVGLVALALVAIACGDDGASDGQVTVPDVVGQSVDFAMGALQAVGLLPDVVEVLQDDPDPGTVFEQVPAAGTEASEGDTVVIKVVADSPSETTTTSSGSTTTSSGSSSTSAPDSASATSTTEQYEDTPTTQQQEQATTTTTQPQDQTAPNLSDSIVLADPIFPEGCGADEGTAYLTATDPSGIGLVSLGWQVIGQYAGQGSGFFGVDLEGSQLIGHIAGLPYLPGDATVQITWRVRDTAGNEGTIVENFLLSDCGL